MPKRYNFAELNWPSQLLPRATHHLGIQMMMISAWLLVDMWTVPGKKGGSEVGVLSGFHGSVDRLTVSSCQPFPSEACRSNIRLAFVFSLHVQEFF